MFYVANRFIVSFVLTIATIIALCIIASTARSETHSYSNSMGQNVGRSDTKGPTSQFYNERGQNTGRVDRRPDGTSNIYNDKGQLIGTSRGTR
jgi:hypothetical protein